jgi:hypothetical protein
VICAAFDEEDDDEEEEVQDRGGGKAGVVGTPQAPEVAVEGAAGGLAVGLKSGSHGTVGVSGVMSEGVSAHECAVCGGADLDGVRVQGRMPDKHQQSPEAHAEALQADPRCGNEIIAA